MMATHRLFFFLVVAAVATSFAHAPDCRDRMRLERTASLFHSYEFAPVEDTPAPAGYEPFYISHYGRHGSRRLTGTYVEDVAAALEKGEASGALTVEGRELLADIRRIAAVHDGMTGELSERGAEEHRALAKRMAARFKGVFASARLVRCQASTVSRVLLSQANFTMALKSEAPALEFEFATGERHFRLLCAMHFLQGQNAADEKIKAAIEKSARSLFDPSRLVRALFGEAGTDADSVEFARNLFIVASDCQCIARETRGLDIYRYFEPGEIDALSRILEAEHYAQMGNSAEFGDAALAAAGALAGDFAKRADDAIAGGAVAADLRFGHDSGLWPLAGLIGIDGPGDRAPFAGSREACPAWKWMPMAANLQMVFYRDKAGDVLVKVLYNEREMRIKGLSPVQWPYYRWRELRERMQGAPASRRCNAAP